MNTDAAIALGAIAFVIVVGGVAFVAGWQIGFHEGWRVGRFDHRQNRNDPTPTPITSRWSRTLRGER